MSGGTVCILAPNGRRTTIKYTPNTTLLQVSSFFSTFKISLLFFVDSGRGLQKTEPETRRI